VKKIALIGSTGMVGSSVSRYFSSKNFKVIEVNKSGVPIVKQNSAIQFNAATDSISQLLDKITDSEITIINCIGWVKQRIMESDDESVSKAIHLNSIFPKSLLVEAEKRSINVIQPGTDCVFNGRSGRYTEKSEKDALDIYGMTKILSEVESVNLLTIRASIVGIEQSGHVGLLDWILGQKYQSKVNGFTNHYWNGVTSLHFAKVLFTIVNDLGFKPGVFHLIPKDQVSKYELLQIMCEKWDRKDLGVMPIEDLNFVNRTLATQYSEYNDLLWVKSGHKNAPSIESMLEEYRVWSSQFDQK
jgi:dTDP-4-dehydrorhamnose reductase